MFKRQKTEHLPANLNIKRSVFMQFQTWRLHNESLSGMNNSSLPFVSKDSGCDSRYRSIVNKLDVMIELVQQHPGCVLAKELDLLLDSMLDHFCSENRVLGQVDFPSSIKHRHHHYSIFFDTAEMRHLLSKGQNELYDRLPKIRQLCLEHINVYDRTFEAFLAP
jgi:hemerythrin